jgi:DME family drug/metabolite transporter
MKNRGYWFILLAACLWGTNGTVQALAPEAAQPLVIGALRILLGGLALLAVAALRGVLRDGRKWAFWPTLAAALSMAAYQLFFFAGVERTGVAVGTIVGIGSTPIFAGPIGYIVRGERPGRRWVIATLLGILGCGLLILVGKSIQLDLLGIFLASLAGASYAVFATASKGLIEQHATEAVMAVTFCLGALFVLPLLFTADLGWLGQPNGALAVLHLGLVTAALGYLLFGRGLKLVPVATAATLTLAEPLTAGLLGVLVLGEKLTIPAFLGILLIFAGLAVLSLAQDRQNTKPPKSK